MATELRRAPRRPVLRDIRLNVGTLLAAVAENEVSPNTVRDREDALASARDACAPRNSRELQQFRVEINLRADKHY